MGVGGQRHAPAALPPGKEPGTYFIESRVGPRSRSERVQKVSPPHRDSIPGLFNP